MKMLSQTSQNREISRFDTVKAGRIRLRKLWLCLERLFYLWLRSHAIPSAYKEEEGGVDTSRPICYVLNSRSYTDLMVLDHHCREIGLPRPLLTPSELGSASPKQGASTYLVGSSLLQKQAINRGSEVLAKVVARVDELGSDVQLVPVSVFWGRDAGREEKSLLKLLFFDDEHGGWLQRFVLFFVQGRNIFCHFGKPISVLKTVQGGGDIGAVARKLSRVLRVHFRRQREAITGPNIYDRKRVVDSIIASKPVQTAINREHEKTKLSLDKVRAKARRYTLEIASDMRPNMLRFLDLVCSFLSKKLYDGLQVKHGEAIPELAKTHELVYVPCHRSHMDYMLLNYVLYHLGVIPPHTAAGVNLNFWPTGTLFRRGGAFFIRRSFAGNRLYSAVFAEYTHFLLSNNYSMCFYPEGGRSRTGKMLRPKLGMLNMLLESQARATERPILIIPVYIGYDRLTEARSYLREMTGATKRKESVGAVIKSRKVLKQRFGSAYINFGTPMLLKEVMRRSSESSQYFSKPASYLAHEIMEHINRAVCVTPVALVATALLAVPQRALSEKDLLETLGMWTQLLKLCPYDSQVSWPESQEPAAILRRAEMLCPLARFQDSSGDVIYVSQKDSALLKYYKNNVLVVFALPSLIASVICRHHQLTASALKTEVEFFYRLLWKELFLKWQPEEVGLEFRKLVDTLCELKLVERVGDELRAPDVTSKAYLVLKNLARINGNQIDRFSVYLSKIFAKPAADFRIHALEADCASAAERLSLLKGESSLDLDKKEFRAFVASLLEMGLIAKIDESTYSVSKQDSPYLQIAKVLELAKFV